VNADLLRVIDQGYEKVRIGNQLVRVAHVAVDKKDNEIFDRPRVLMLSSRELFLKWFFPSSKNTFSSPIRDYAKEIHRDIHDMVSSIVFPCNEAENAH